MCVCVCVCVFSLVVDFCLKKYCVIDGERTGSWNEVEGRGGGGLERGNKK